MDEQEQQNQQDSFFKQEFNKGKQKAKNAAKKQTRKILIKILANPLTWKLLAIIAIAIALIVFIAGFLDIVIDFNVTEVNDAKKTGIITSYTGTISSTTTGDSSSAGTNISGDGSTSQTPNSDDANRVVINKNNDGTGYEINYDNSTENLENVKEKLEKDSIESTEFSDIELGIIGALIDNGADLQYYTEKELHCFPAFIKAEACTQNLDLRPNSEKIVDGEYVPKKFKDLSENEIPGVILVQRSNTNSDTKTILEYKDKEGENGFDKLVEDNNEEARNYFTIDDKGNLIIAKWDHVKITVNGEYPENLDSSEKDMPKDEYVITTESIPYHQYISKYKMPFEFLIQLLATTKDTNFCMKLVDCALESKIVINIQEEETVTVTDETRKYTVHSKDEKYVNYQVSAAGQQIVQENNYLLKYAEDDEHEQNNCTNYSKEDVTVKVHTEYTSHSYVFEILEVDNWLAHYKKTYGDMEQQGPTTTTSDSEPEESEYKQIETDVEYPITDTNTINNDKDVKTFIETTETNYEPRIIVPSVTITDYTDDDGNKFKAINVASGTKAGNKYYSEIKDENDNGTGKYNLPTTITVKSNTVSSTNTTKQIPQINYTFKLKTSENILTGKTTYKYELQTDIDPLVECITSSLNIKEFEKIILDNYITTTVTKYPSDPNPITTTEIYAKDENEELQKFLLAYDNSQKAQNQLNSIDSWLFEMMEENEATVELVDVVKYLLYLYDDVDRGVTEFVGFEQLFNPDGFVSVTNGIYGNTVEEKIWWALIDAGYSKEAAAGAMGNFYGESGFRTNNLENSYEINGSNSLGYTDETYTQAINDGTYTREQFISDHKKDNCGAGYGLAQWTYYNRKAGLYDFAKHRGVNIDDVNMQIEYLLGELSYSGGADGYAKCALSSYKGFTVDDWENATSPEEAAEAFCWIFEKPSEYNSTRGTKAREYYEKYKDATKPSFSGATVKAAGYEFPQYYQRDYSGSYGTSTISSSGCGPTSLAMILAGIKGDPSITPETVVNNIKAYWPSGAYYVSGKGSSHCIFRSDFLEKYYGVTSEVTYPSEAEAIKALEKGYALIGGETGHILAIIPAPDEYKAQGYKFYILDSGRGHGGPYKSASQASAVVQGNLRFIAIIKP